MAQGRTDGGQAGFPLFFSLLPRVCVSVAALPPFQQFFGRQGWRWRCLQPQGGNRFASPCLTFAPVASPPLAGLTEFKNVPPSPFFPFEKALQCPTGKKNKMFFRPSCRPRAQRSTKTQSYAVCTRKEGGREGGQGSSLLRILSPRFRNPFGRVPNHETEGVFFFAPLFPLVKTPTL